VQELAALADLPAEQADALVLAADEACTNTIEHAFEPGEAGVFKLAGELTPSALTLSIHDRGLPFDESLAPAYTPPQSADVTRVSARGLGLHLIQQAVDEAQWINHGREGKELRLVKRRLQRDITEQLSAAELTPFREDAPRAPEQNYTVRRLRPEDALQVAQCIYRTYGYTYSNEDLYYPERIVHLNATGELISAVGLDEAGNIVGYCALERPGLGPIAELGQAVVIPAHRGRGVFGLMIDYLTAEARHLGLVGLYTQATAAHVFTQRAVEDYMHFCGMTLGYIPRTRVYKNIQTHSSAERTSLTLQFVYLVEPPTVSLYAPPPHREMLTRIYAHLHAPVEFRESSVAAEEPGQVSVHLNRSYGTGMIRVQRVGADSAAEIRRAVSDLSTVAGAEVVYLELPLAQAGTPDLCRAAEEVGFFFSGVGPHFAPDGDALRLQFLNTALDPALVQVYSPFGQELLAYVAKERERVTPDQRRANDDLDQTPSR
jgi:anti-sigma regulatory factor (Ser/Thr protein kinase)/GNAT superfamily N-acetyltransferase